MKRMFMLMVLVASTAFAQEPPTSGANLSFGFGKANMYSMKTLETETTDFFQAGLQLDAVKGNFVFGPEVRAMVGVESFPSITFGGVTGYDNGKFRLVGTVGAISSIEVSDYELPIDTFQGIVGAELGYGPLFIRGDWYTNLHTYFYSYSVQAGFKLKF